MPYRHPKTGIWYFYRRIPGFRGEKRLKLTLQTRAQNAAIHREGLIMELGRAGRHKLLDALFGGPLSVEHVAAAAAAGTLERLQTDPSSVPLSEAAEAALVAKEGEGKAGSTVQRYREGLANFGRLVGSESSVVRALEQDSIRAFVAQRLKEGAANGTVNNDLIAVSVLASYAEERGWVTKRPRIEKLRSTKRVRYLEAAEREAYLKALEPQYRPLMRLLMWTGMRLGEAEGLRVADVKLGDDPTALVRSGKSEAAARAVPLPPELVGEIRPLVEGRGQGERVFVGFARRTAQKAHTKACENAKPPILDYRLHDHRHTAAVALARSGIPLGVLKGHLGHATLDMTMRYAQFHPAYSDVETYYRRVGRSLNGGGHGG